MWRLFNDCSPNSYETPVETGTATTQNRKWDMMFGCDVVDEDEARATRNSSSSPSSSPQLPTLPSHSASLIICRLSLPKVFPHIHDFLHLPFTPPPPHAGLVLFLLSQPVHTSLFLLFSSGSFHFWVVTHIPPADRFCSGPELVAGLWCCCDVTAWKWICTNLPDAAGRSEHAELWPVDKHGSASKVSLCTSYMWEEPTVSSHTL